LDGWGRQLFGSVSTANFFQPQDDLGFKIEYNHPYCKGELDAEKSSFRTAIFNSRKISPVFAGGPLLDNVPSVWVDRAGMKASFTQNYSRQSRCTTSAVLEEITARDESGATCPNGSKQVADGSVTMDGPPTTHSGSGCDKLVCLQGNLTRDTTKFVKNTPIGSRDILQVEQSLGIGSSFPIYNRSSLEASRFIQLLQTKKRNDIPPPVLVMHAKGGHIIGDCAVYDAFTLGGPHSCRGYGVGELGVSRSFMEIALELRLPVPYMNTHSFLFWEKCSDLGSSKSVIGNPTEYYCRAGQGSCFGVGLKLGPVRAEWVHDDNQSKGTCFLRFGERF
jgi:outer membrane protein assembly factor BamA